MSEPRARESYSEFIDELGLVYVKGQELSAQDLANLCEIGESEASKSTWLRGDAYALAKELYGDEWFDVVDFELNLRTLDNYARVCKHFPRERRLKSKFLKFRHYDALKGIKDPALQDYWLKRADKERITSDELREAIKEVTPIRRESRVLEVGLIDITLLDLGVIAGTKVRVLYEIETAAA